MSMYFFKTPTDRKSPMLDFKHAWSVIRHSNNIRVLVVQKIIVGVLPRARKCGAVPCINSPSPRIAIAI